MKTKEDYIKEISPNGTLSISNPKVLGIMDEYAKEVAIDFRKWLEQNEYENSVSLGRQLTNEEFYNYYKNSIFPSE